ncbi:uncharacterized protein LOC114868552 [Betta splendens]|uniref:Uncharacterized protein LOC114868552 n=1 Tax=Betta splendens TaxID=158456 RepID=A0A9W2Y7U1_BETSP|nr:uncharacterized protein LOC114868552 [Betta splendens]
MDSLYEAVQSSSNAPPLPVPSRSSSRSCSRSCSPAALLDDNARWRGSGRSISMEMPHVQGSNSNKKKSIFNFRAHIYKSASDNEALDNPSRNAVLWQPARSREDLVHITSNHNEETRKAKHRSETKAGKGAHHCGTKKKEKPPSGQSSHANAPLEPKPAMKRSQKPGRKAGGRSRKEGSKKNLSSAVHPPSSALSPPTGPHRLDVSYRQKTKDKRPYLGKASTLPPQDSAAPGRCSGGVDLPGGATPTHAHQQRWSNPGDRSPAWGAIQHTCCRPLTEYRAYARDFPTSNNQEWEGRRQQDGGSGQDCGLQISSKVPRSITDVDLLESNVSLSL